MDKKIPAFLYGTAWKEEQTSQLVFKALAAGFIGIDTANQRKHYFEEEVGKGLKEAYQQLGLARDDLFLQTKYTYSDGQDHRLPYDLKAKIQEQVLMSCESSLNHLCTEYIDSLILHGLSQPSVFSEPIPLAMPQSSVTGTRAKRCATCSGSITVNPSGLFCLAANLALVLSLLTPTLHNRPLVSYTSSLTRCAI